jgi:energy-coupling factor transporter ATP-binding protein EcfA2
MQRTTIKANRGRLFVFEGPDDVGKSTLAKLLNDYLRQTGKRTELLAFPGNSTGTLGELVYRLYHNPKAFGVVSVTSIGMQLMVTAAHVDVIESRIKPLIRSGVDVVLDRFWWSTWVYARIDGVPNTFRDRMIDFEMQSWEGIQPTTIFVVLRESPLLEQPQNHRWPEILTLYKQLSEIEGKNVHIQLVTNEGTIEEYLKTDISTLEK